MINTHTVNFLTMSNQYVYYGRGSPQSSFNLYKPLRSEKSVQRFSNRIYSDHGRAIDIEHSDELKNKYGGYDGYQQYRYKNQNPSIFNYPNWLSETTDQPFPIKKKPSDFANPFLKENR